MLLRPSLYGNLLCVEQYVTCEVLEEHGAGRSESWSCVLVRFRAHLGTFGMSTGGVLRASLGVLAYTEASCTQISQLIFFFSVHL
jgi:hypothetical protein